MNKISPNSFRARIDIIGINPFVYVPEKILSRLFAAAGKHRGKIRVKMTIDGHAFRQTLVKYGGHWRLYLNLPMRKAAGKDVGDTALFGISFDGEERQMPMHPRFADALSANKEAKKVFDELTPSRRLEVSRYIAGLKTEAAVDRNIQRAINFLLGSERFAGRDKP